MISLILSALTFGHTEAHTALPEDINRWLDSVVLLQTDGAWCSGAVIASDQVVTAYHCVATGGQSRIELRDGRVFEGHAVSAFPKSDVAISRVDLPTQLQPLKFRTDAPIVGTSVYALGHPFAPLADKKWLRGTLRWSVSSGLVSAVGDTFIQTDASLNPGNSGGPIVDAQGQIVGIASRKLRAENIAFLGPASEVLNLQSKPEKLKWWGGQLAIGGWYSMLGSENLSASMGGYLQYRMRERLIATAAIGTPIVTLDESVVNNGFAGIAFRQGFGYGSAYTTFDVGGGLVATSTFETSTLTLQPEIFGQIGIASVGLRYGMVGLGGPSPQHQVMVMFDLLGVVQVF